MNFLADESVERELVEQLRQAGQAVQYVIVAAAISKHAAELERAFSIITPGITRIRQSKLPEPDDSQD